MSNCRARQEFRVWLEPIALVALTAFTRFVFRSHYLYDIDSVNFALALDRFDPAVHQPHPPGYFLYVCVGRLSNLFFHDANAALVTVSIVFSCGAGAVIFLFTKHWFGAGAARFAGLIFLFSPLIWFHGTVALTYIVEAFFSALTGYLCWLTYSGKARYAVPAALVTAMAAGFRPSSLILLCPLLLFSLLRISRRRALAGLATLWLTLAAWVVPMLWLSGGTEYLSSLLSLWQTVPSKQTVFNSSPLNSLARATFIVGIYFLGFGCAAFLPLWGRKEPGRRDAATDRSKLVFTWAWVGPGLLFFVFVFLKFVNSGYLLVLCPPICAWMGLWASQWYASLRLPRIWKIGALTGCALVNTMIWMYAPVYCSWREVRRFESELAHLILVLPQVAAPEDTLVVGADSHFLGYRHAGYYLPGYTTIQFPEVHLARGPRIFVMRGRNTTLANRFPVNAGQKFVFFPLPAGDSESVAYMARLRARFLPGGIRMMHHFGSEFAGGDATDLPRLFPNTISASVENVRGN